MQIATWVSLGVFATLLLGAAWLLWSNRPLVNEWAREFVRITGGPGVAMGFFLPDAFAAPIPNDIFTVFGRMGGMPFWNVVAWGTLGSLSGGCTGWLIGRYAIGRSRWLQGWMQQKGGDTLERIRRRGAWFLAFAAITPLPYSLACWGAGLVRMPFTLFLGVSLLRAVRVALYLWLIEQGVVSLGGP